MDTEYANRERNAAPAPAVEPEDDDNADLLKSLGM